MPNPERSPYDPPTHPYTQHLERLVAQLESDIDAAEPMHSEHAGAPDELAARVPEAVEGRGQALVELSHRIHATPELGYEEHTAVAAIAELLDQHGHDVEVGAYGVDTALRTRVGHGRPRVAVLAEYDALPGLGHACGHNVIAATGVGAFLGLGDLGGDIDGSVELIGTPAEEGGGGKELIARAGGFDEIDAAIMVHPMGMEIGEHPWLGVRQVAVTYHGLSAHASVTPFLGRNALDAVVSAYNGMSQLRQHILPSDRIHGVVTDGGQKPNIVPERASATFYLRSAEPDTMAELADRARGVFEAAALATGTQLDIQWDPCPVYLPVRTNRSLAGRYAASMSGRGRKVLPAGVVPPELTGSTDMGNVSVRVPGIHPTMAIAPPWVSIHTPEFATYAVGEEADRGTIDGAIGLARTALDFLTDGDLRAAVAEEFEAAGGVLDIDALLE